jgi:hypothetical protein
MNKRWKRILFGSIGMVFVMFVIIIALYIRSIGWNHIKLMYSLHTTDKSVVKIDDPSNGHGLYLTKMRHPAEMIKERMQREDWHFVMQEGSGYFFEKDGQDVVVTTKIWPNRYFVRISVQHDVVNIAD